MGVGAVTGNRASPPDEIKQRIRTKLHSLYEQGEVESLLTAFDEIVSRTSVPNGNRRPFDERDVLLIAYGDHVNDVREFPLQTLKRLTKTHLDGVIDGIHVLPFHPSKHDGGFSVEDFEVVKPDLGGWDDIEALAADRFFMADCVINHISASHKWFQGFLAGDPRYQDFFIRESADFDTTNVTRPRATPLFTSFQTVNGPESIWTTFGPDQVDLNYRCPAVLSEIIEVVARYVGHGARLLRLDATHFIWKESGTTCVHRDQVHTVIQIIRDVLDLIDPSIIVVNETNVPHAENVTYFGDGHNEAQMVYNFAFPTLLAQAIQTGDGLHLQKWASEFELPSDETCFFNHTACHDGVSMRGSQEILSPEERLVMVSKSIEHGGSILYRSSPTGDVPYEMCITYFDLLSKPGDRYSIDRFVLSQAIQLALAGVPAIYFSSLFGAETWAEGVSKEGGVRNANRERYDYNDVHNQLSDPSSKGGEVFARLSGFIKARTSDPAFHPHAPQEVLDLGPGVFGLKRTPLPDGPPVLALHNLTEQAIEIALPSGDWRNLLSDVEAVGRLSLEPYNVAWLKRSAE